MAAILRARARARRAWLRQLPTAGGVPDHRDKRLADRGVDRGAMQPRRLDRRTFEQRAKEFAGEREFAPADRPGPTELDPDQQPVRCFRVELRRLRGDKAMAQPRAERCCRRRDMGGEQPLTAIVDAIDPDKATRRGDHRRGEPGTLVHHRRQKTGADDREGFLIGRAQPGRIRSALGRRLAIDRPAEFEHQQIDAIEPLAPRGDPNLLRVGLPVDEAGCARRLDHDRADKAQMAPRLPHQLEHVAAHPAPAEPQPARMELKRSARNGSTWRAS